MFLSLTASDRVLQRKKRYNGRALLSTVLSRGFMRTVLNILNFILNNYSIDGIECYYTTFSNEQHFNLLNICKKNKLFISGGSDFHGKYKPDVDIGVGYGDLQIPTDILSNWINKVKVF